MFTGPRALFLVFLFSHLLESVRPSSEVCLQAGLSLSKAPEQGLGSKGSPGELGRQAVRPLPLGGDSLSELPWDTGQNQSSASSHP